MSYVLGADALPLLASKNPRVPDATAPQVTSPVPSWSHPAPGGDYTPPTAAEIAKVQADATAFAASPQGQAPVTAQAQERWQRALRVPPLYLPLSILNYGARTAFPSGSGASYTLLASLVALGAGSGYYVGKKYKHPKTGAAVGLAAIAAYAVPMLFGVSK